jgi:hypothetical protein
MAVVPCHGRYRIFGMGVSSNNRQSTTVQRGSVGQGNGIFLGCSSFLKSNSGYPEEYGMYVCVLVGCRLSNNVHNILNYSYSHIYVNLLQQAKMVAVILWGRPRR